jgi:hypothetical protein
MCDRNAYSKSSAHRQIGAKMKYCRKEPPHDLVEAVQVRDTNIREIRALAKDKLVNYGIDRLGRWVEISTGPKGKTDQAGLGEFIVRDGDTVSRHSFVWFNSMYEHVEDPA